jgi:hypothetical protein
MSPGLDSVLGGLRDHEGMARKRRTINTDEVVIRCDYADILEAAKDNVENLEADELIWWSWDEKILGFGDL